ncbi:MAG: adenylyltransferase/cytidyltransferase family protein [Nanoarchaeota archaeon]
MAQTSINGLQKIRENHKNETIVFCSGTFDLTHAGHVLFFEECKKQGDILVVAVSCDKNMKTYKGENRPIIGEKARLKLIDSLKPVDYCLLDPPIARKDDLLAGLIPIFENLRPNKWVVNEDAFNISEWKRYSSKFNIELVILPRSAPPEFEQISTTKIMEKIKSI